MTDKLQFPDGFLWGGATAANQCEGVIMKMAVAWPMWMWYRLGLIVMRLLRVRKRCSTLKRAIFYPAKEGIDMYHRYKEDIALFGKWALKPIACPLPGLGSSQKGMNWSRMKRVYSSMKTS